MAYCQSFALIFGALILVLSGDYSYRGISNALFIPGFSVFAIFIIRLVSHWVMFDLIGYSFTRIWHGFRRSNLEEMKSASEYVYDKNESRKTKDNYFLPYIVISLLFIGVAAIFTFI